MDVLDLVIDIFIYAELASCHGTELDSAACNWSWIQFFKSIQFMKEWDQPEVHRVKYNPNRKKIQIITLYDNHNHVRVLVDVWMFGSWQVIISLVYGLVFT